ncbi:UNVERIFIED_CONTAM: putative mitochondrial protein [Sesamum radiatum]|uniref:Mitochondrial protein n=1 Tax=Sesamum radiatum TaxID=300843 RepID=A0AAW2LPY1_SESRA
MLLVSSVSFSFILSGEQFGRLSPQRGLRQEDPLSPFLFLFCFEALSSLFREAECPNFISRARIARSAPCISHLLFADDNLIFCEATSKSMQVISHILQRYSTASGQLINFDKSSMVISNNANQEEADHLALILGVRVVDKHEKHLGLPAVGGKSKSVMFAVPTLASLARRIVGVDNLYPVCKDSKEDAKHVLLKCSFSRQVWAFALLPYSIISVWPSDEEGWFRQICYFLESDDADYFLMLCWILWNNHNAVLMEGTHTSGIDLVCSARLKL